MAFKHEQTKALSEKLVGRFLNQDLRAGSNFLSSRVGTQFLRRIGYSAMTPGIVKRLCQNVFGKAQNAAKRIVLIIRVFVSAFVLVARSYAERAAAPASDLVILHAKLMKTSSKNLEPTP